MTLPMRTIQKIHSIKVTLAAQAEWEYAAALQVQASAKQVLGELQQELADAANVLGSRQTVGLSAAELQEWNQWLHSLLVKVETQQQFCAQTDALAEQCRGKLMERHQDEEVWQKLRERNTQLTEHEFRKREQAELDEIGGRNRKPV